jgi:DNA-binding XRE family transcriptional regulator
VTERGEPLRRARVMGAPTPSTFLKREMLMRYIIDYDYDDRQPSLASTGRAAASRGDGRDRSTIAARTETRAHEPVLKELGARIRLIRRELHLSQEECAERCHIDRAHISRLERGRPNTTVLHLAKLAQGLGVEMADLFKP